MEQQPRGRGAAYIKKLQELQAKVGQPTEESTSSFSTIPIISSGRGICLQQHLQTLPAQSETRPLTIPKGRASLAQKLFELNKLSELQLESTKQVQQTREVQETDVPSLTESETREPITYKGIFKY